MAATTLRIGLLGAAEVRSEVHPSPEVADAFGLFLARAQLLDWSGSGSSSEAWGMNFAAFGSQLDPRHADDIPDEPELVASAQVVANADQATPPIIPLAVCLADTVQRVASLRLTGLRLEAIGVQTNDERWMRVLMPSLGWFPPADPREMSAATAEIRLAHGSPTFDPQQLAARVRPWHLDPFRIDVDQGTVRLAMPEWSVEALAWGAAVVAHATGVFAGTNEPPNRIELRQRA